MRMPARTRGKSNSIAASRRKVYSNSAQRSSPDLQAAFLDLNFLRFCSLDQFPVVQSLQTLVVGSGLAQHDPQQPFPANAQFQEFQRFERSEPVCAIVQFDAAHFLADPRAHFLHLARTRADTFGQSAQHVPVGIDLTVQFRRKLPQRLVCVPLANILQSLQRVFGAGQMVVQVCSESISHLILRRTRGEPPPLPVKSIIPGSSITPTFLASSGIPEKPTALQCRRASVRNACALGSAASFLSPSGPARITTASNSTDGAARSAISAAWSFPSASISP